MGNSGSDTPDWRFTLYAGPLLRRTEPSRVCVWVARSAPVPVKGEFYVADQLREQLTQPGPFPFPPIGEGKADSIPLGKRLHITLVQIDPKSARTKPSKQKTRPTHSL